jgi:hypothetical protein
VSLFDRDKYVQAHWREPDQLSGSKCLYSGLGARALHSPEGRRLFFESVIAVTASDGPDEMGRTVLYGSGVEVRPPELLSTMRLIGTKLRRDCDDP